MEGNTARAQRAQKAFVLMVFFLVLRKRGFCAQQQVQTRIERLFTPTIVCPYIRTCTYMYMCNVDTCLLDLCCGIQFRL